MKRDWNWRSFKTDLFHKRRIKTYYHKYGHHGVYVNEIRYPCTSWLDFLGTKEANKLKYQTLSVNGNHKQKYSGTKKVYDRKISRKNQSLGDRNLDKIELRKILIEYGIE